MNDRLAAVARGRRARAARASARSASAAPTPTSCSRRRPRADAPAPSRPPAAARPLGEDREPPSSGRPRASRRTWTADRTSRSPTSPTRCRPAGAPSPTGGSWSPADREDAARAAARAGPRSRGRRPSREQAGGRRRVPVPRPGRAVRRHGAGLYRDEPVFRRELDRCARDPARPRWASTCASVLFPRRRADGDGAERLARPRSPSRRCSPSSTRSPAVASWSSACGRPPCSATASASTWPPAWPASSTSRTRSRSSPSAAGSCRHCRRAAMLAVALAEAELRPRLGGRARASPPSTRRAQCVASGRPAERSRRLEARLGGRGRSRAGGSPPRTPSTRAMMDPVLAAFRARRGARDAAARRACRSSPTSPATGSATEQATDPDYWVRHLRETVRFADGLVRLAVGPPPRLLEVGPGRRSRGSPGSWRAWTCRRSRSRRCLAVAMRTPNESTSSRPWGGSAIRGHVGSVAGLAWRPDVLLRRFQVCDHPLPRMLPDRGRVSVGAAYLVRRGLQKARCRASMMSRTSVRASE